MGIYLPSAGTLSCAVWSGAGISHSQGIPPNFYLPPVSVGPPDLPTAPAPAHHPTSLHLSAHLRDSAPPTHMDECGFFKPLVVRLPYSSIF